MQKTRLLALALTLSFGLLAGPAVTNADAFCWWNCNYAKTKYPSS